MADNRMYLRCRGCGEAMVLAKMNTAKSMIFMRHRVKFIRPNGTTGSPFFGSCLVAWGDKCDHLLRESKIEGKYVVLNR